MGPQIRLGILKIEKLVTKKWVFNGFWKCLYVYAQTCVLILYPQVLVLGVTVDWQSPFAGNIALVPRIRLGILKIEKLVSAHEFNEWV